MFETKSELYKYLHDTSSSEGSGYEHSDPVDATPAEEPWTGWHLSTAMCNHDVASKVLQR